MEHYKSPKQVLIVDDEPHILIALNYLLEDAGMQVIKAQNGEEALQILDEHQPDVIILDVMMPGMDGFEVAHRIRKRPQQCDTTIIFLTARGTQTDRFNGYSSGAEFYVTKPFENQHLLDIVNELFEFG